MDPAAPGGGLRGAGAGELLPGALAAYKVPRYWQFVESFPMTVTGKIQKFQLREMAVELLGRHADAAEETA